MAKNIIIKGNKNVHVHVYAKPKRKAPAKRELSFEEKLDIFLDMNEKFQEHNMFVQSLGKFDFDDDMK